MNSNNERQEEKEQEENKSLSEVGEDPRAEYNQNRRAIIMISRLLDKPILQGLMNKYCVFLRKVVDRLMPYHSKLVDRSSRGNQNICLRI